MGKRLHLRRVEGVQIPARSLAVHSDHKGFRECNCGENVTYIHGHTVRPKDESPRKHSPEYNSYFGMKDRCYNEKHVRYHRYGGRGITVCERWLNGEDGLSGFECFLKDIGLKPSRNYSIERKDNNKGYSPENCVWASITVQNRNSSSTRYVEIEGERISFAEAIERFGKVSYATARMRVQRGWDDVKAIITPIS